MLFTQAQLDIDIDIETYVKEGLKGYTLYWQHWVPLVERVRLTNKLDSFAIATVMKYHKHNGLKNKWIHYLTVPEVRNSKSILLD